VEKNIYPPTIRTARVPAALQIATPLLQLAVLVCYIFCFGTTAFAQFGFAEPASIVTRGQQEAKWDAILLRPHPELGNQERTVGDLIKQLRQIGLPINLHQSAIDDSCAEDELITLELPSLTLLVRLQTALEEINATLSVSRGRILIVSLSNVWDPELVGLRVYDVARYTSQPARFAKLIPRLFSENNWGYGKIRAEQLPPPNDHLITVVAPYYVQSEVARLLKNIDEKEVSTLVLKPLNADSRPVALGPDANDGSFGSKPIRLPGEELEPENHGRGGGGGVF